MTAAKTPWKLILAGFIVVVALPLAGQWLRRHSERGCALDGTTIQPIYQVEIVDGLDRRQVFCCLRCAQIWLRKQAVPPRAITVTDEASGQGIDSASAYYVRSSVVTTPTTGNRIHVFARQVDAEKHADTFRGTVLLEAEQPFRW